MPRIRAAMQLIRKILHQLPIPVRFPSVVQRFWTIWTHLKSSKAEFVPSDGWILAPTEVEFTEGESVHDVLQRVCKEAGIQMESSFTPAYNSAYVEGINNLYEFDCGELSGWMFSVNGWYPNYGCSKYTVNAGDEIWWVYTCDLGKDVGDNSMY